MKKKQNKMPYVKKNSDGLHYVNEKHCCFGKNSPEDDSKDEGTFFQRWSLKTRLCPPSCILTLYYSWLILHSKIMHRNICNITTDVCFIKRFICGVLATGMI